MNELFVSAFESVFVIEHQTTDLRMDNICIRYSALSEVLLNLASSSSAASYGLHPRLRSSCAEVLSLPLAIMFQKSMETSVLPSGWKISRVVPIFKSGSEANPRVSLTSACCKVLGLNNC